MLMCSAEEHVTEDWAFEVVFEMREPMRRAHNCRPLADYRIGKACAVWRDAVLNVLLHAVPNGDMRPILSLLRRGGNLMQLCCYCRKNRHMQCKQACLLYPPKADMCSALPNVCFGPIADITPTVSRILLRRDLINVR